MGHRASIGFLALSHAAAIHCPPGLICGLLLQIDVHGRGLCRRTKLKLYVSGKASCHVVPILKALLTTCLLVPLIRVSCDGSCQESVKGHNKEACFISQACNVSSSAIQQHRLLVCYCLAAGYLVCYRAFYNFSQT